jgi:pimeloyl-ACP methyl ester carboxylesterase
MTRDPVRQSRGTIPFAIAGGILGGLAFSVIAGISVVTGVMARRIVTPPTKREEEVRILAVDLAAGVITLRADADSVLPGEYSLWFEGDTGHARLGEVVSSTATTVTRVIIRVDFGDLLTATRGRLGGWVYLGPWDLGVPYQDVLVQTPLGPAPAWLVPAAEPTDRWVIQVHGRAVRRQEGLRGVPVFRESGYTTLLVSYRNDGDAPRSTDHRYGLGDTEWEDVHAAVSFAVQHGATSVVLMGWSMGGAISLQAATRSTHPGVIRGVVLDSPVIDWADVVAFQGALLRLPPPIASGAVQLLGQGWGRAVTGQIAPIDFARLDFVARSGELDFPVLLMHSDDDGYVPATGSRALAESRPDIVTFVAFTEARHTKLWNYDPERWNSAIAEWLAKLS